MRRGALSAATAGIGIVIVMVIVIVTAVLTAPFASAVSVTVADTAATTAATTATALPNGQVGTDYSGDLGSAGPAPHTVVGQLPPGLELRDQETPPVLAGTPTQAGSFDVTLQAADGSSVPITLTVDKGTPSWDLQSHPPGDLAVGDTFQLDVAIKPSDRSVTYWVDQADSDHCSVSSDGLVSFRTTDECAVGLDVAGDADWLDLHADVTRFTVEPGGQTITFTSTAPAHPVVGGQYDVAATGGDSGEPVTLTVDPAGDQGACTLSAGGRVTFAGQGTCVVAADQAGDHNHRAAATVRQAMTVEAAPVPPTQATAAGPAGHDPQTSRISPAVAGLAMILVSSTPPESPTVGGTYQIDASSAPTNRPVAFTVNPASTHGTCTVNRSGLVRFTGAGHCVVDLDQAKTVDLAAAHSMITLTVSARPRVSAAPAQKQSAAPAEVLAVAPAAQRPEEFRSAGTAGWSLLFSLGGVLVVGGLVVLAVLRRGSGRHR